MQRLQVRDGCFRDSTGKPVYLIGANYWPKRTGPWMYRDPWDSKAVGADLAELAALGANVVRLFCFLPDFMPAPDVVSTHALSRLGSAIELAAQAGLWSIPTLLVGHMSGENWEADWSRGRNWYADPLLLDASELLIGTVASHFAGDERIAAWLITNEWPLFAGLTNNEQGMQWAQRLSAILRAADPGCNLSLGDGAWDVVNGQPNGLASPSLREIVDFFGPHFYPKESDSLRHSAFAGFAMRMLQGLEKPVLLEEFGCSSDQADDEFAAGYYRTVLWSAFGAGNCGALFWNSHDFTVADRPPYSHHPYELHFGVIRTDGSLKPQAREVERFAAYMSSHDLEAWQALPPSVAVGRTSFYLERFPFDWGWTKTALRDVYLQTYAGLLAAGLDAGFEDLARVASSQVRLLVVPCLQQLTTKDAAQLELFVRNGGTLYLSYGGEPWFPNLERFIGARPRIRYGLVASPPTESLRLKFKRDFGNIARATELQFTIRGERRRCAALICELRDAFAVASDQDGNVALLERKLGSGRIIFMAYPLEYYFLGDLEANADAEIPRLYQAVAASANALPAVRAIHPALHSFQWIAKRNPAKRRLLVVNRGWRAVETSITGVSVQLVDVETGERFDARKIPFESKGVRMLEFTQA